MRVPNAEHEVAHYVDREERARYILAHFEPYLSGRVLDVGCGDSYLAPYVSRYVGLDIAGRPDVVADLEWGRIPFQTDAFDAVICTDVLEHIEPLWGVFAELCRVARTYVLISVPNAYALGWRLKFLRGQVIAKEYSLAPRNRHKWLPNLSEFRALARARLPGGWRVRAEHPYYPSARWRIGPVYRVFARARPNLLATAYWALFERIS